MAEDIDALFLARVEDAVGAAGEVLKRRFSSDARPGDLTQLVEMIKANDAAVSDMLRAALYDIRPQAGWIEDEEEEGDLPPGEWWLVDPVEGNVNHIHGGTDWGVTVTLIRDGAPILSVVHLPMSGDRYAAIKGQGAYLNGAPLKVSQKVGLAAALVATGQAKPHEDAHTHQRIGASVTAMLEAALLVRVSVPATLLLIEVAAGRMELFWQYSQVRAGLLAGALLVTEAGGLVTDLGGQAWTLESSGFLASAPAVQQDAIAIFSTLG